MSVVITSGASCPHCWTYIVIPSPEEEDEVGSEAWAAHPPEDCIAARDTVTGDWTVPADEADE